MAEQKVPISVAWVDGKGQVETCEFLVPAGMSVCAALQLCMECQRGGSFPASELLCTLSGVSPAPLGVAVFGKRVSLFSLLAPGDRVELLKPLPRDPKEARRRREVLAKKGKVMPAQ